MKSGRTYSLWNAKLAAPKRFFSLMLGVSFAISPLSVAFAQEASSDTPPVVDTTNATSADEPADTGTPPDAEQSSPTLSIPGVDSETPPDNAPSDATAQTNDTSQTPSDQI